MTKNIFTTVHGSVAVVGTTGQQGQAAVSTLLDRGARVRALVRDPAAGCARLLAEAGAELSTADPDEADTLVGTLRGVAADFSRTTFSDPGRTEGEVEHGRGFGNVVRDAGVERVVDSSVGCAARSTGTPHFESKRRIEEHFEALGPHTVFIRPTFFMFDFASFSQPVMEADTPAVGVPMPDGVPLQMISVRDIVRPTVVALLDPDRVPGGAFEIAADELTGEEVAAVFSRVETSRSVIKQWPSNSARATQLRTSHP